MNKVFIFALGAAVGSLVTWKIVEQKYKKIADEEIDSVIEQFKNRFSEDYRENFKKLCNDVASSTIEKIKKKDSEEMSKGKTYEEIIKESGYITEKCVEEDEDDNYTVEVDNGPEGVRPYVITPDEFGSVVGYDYKSLVYYEDGVLADDDDIVVSDAENLIGDALDHMGKFEDDCIHVRNENIECDIEILRSEKTFSELNKEAN